MYYFAGSFLIGNIWIIFIVMLWTTFFSPVELVTWGFRVFGFMLWAFILMILFTRRWCLGGGSLSSLWWLDLDSSPTRLMSGLSALPSGKSSHSVRFPTKEKSQRPGPESIRTRCRSSSPAAGDFAARSIVHTKCTSSAVNCSVTCSVMQ